MQPFSFWWPSSILEKFQDCTDIYRLLLLLSPSRTLLECRSNQRIRPKTDSRVPKCRVPLTPSNRVRGWAQWHWQISGPLRAHPTDLLGCSLQHQLAPQPAADIPKRYEKSSLDLLHTICKQGQPLGGDDSHMSGDDSHMSGVCTVIYPGVERSFSS